MFSIRYAGLAGLLQPATPSAFLLRHGIVSWSSPLGWPLHFRTLGAHPRKEQGQGQKGERQAEPAPSKSILEAPLDDSH